MVSVLVSVYNAELTLRRCLDSLLGQTLADIQIVCIDDASTDSSPDILRAYAEAHANIQVVTLAENHGQAYARNQGIPLLRGEYTAFLDSDDWMEADALERVVDTFKANDDVDCVMMNVIYDYPDGRSHAYRKDFGQMKAPFPRMTGFDAFARSLSWNVHGWYVARTWLYQQFPFDDTCHSYSDDNVTMAHYRHSRNVCWCDARYHFVQNAGSCTHAVSMHRFDWMLANESLHRQLLAWNTPEPLVREYEAHRYYVLLDCHRMFLRHRAQFTAHERKDILGKLHHTWLGIDTWASLPRRVWLKPGYMPLHPFWWLFRLEQWLFCLIRRA